MNKLSFEEQRAIDELTKFWQTREEPKDLLNHISHTLISGGNRVTYFLAKVYHELHANKFDEYVGFSTPEFNEFLTSQCRQLIQANSISKSQKEVVLPAKTVESRRDSAIDMPTVHVKEPRFYINNCWKCHEPISSDTDERCHVCGLFICSNCHSCFCH